MVENTIDLPNGYKAYADSQPGSCGLNEVFNVKAYTKHYPLTKGMRVLDAGACVGMFTLKAAKIVGEKGFVVAVEPHAEAFHWLLRNVELNKCGNVVCVNAALWDRVGLAKLSVGWLGATSLVHNYKDRSVLVGTVTADHLKHLLGLDSFDFLKLDTEGAEVQILNGLTLDATMITSATMFIALESHGDDEAIKRHLTSEGFKVLVEERVNVGTSMIYACNVEGVL